ncbi:MAG TPA: hypothetical protein VIH71_15490 [Solirubrobacteraceae bacterium]
MPVPRGATARTGRPETRRAWIRRSLLLALTTLVVVAAVAPAVQAQSAGEVSPEEAATAALAPEAAAEAQQTLRVQRAATRQAEREARRQARRERQEAKRAARATRSSNPSVQNGSRPRTNGNVIFSCTGVKWQFTRFHEGTNTVQTLIRLYPEGNGTQPISIPQSFTFTGSSYETTTPLQAPPGEYRIDAWAKWSGNGMKGSFDILGRLVCSADPEFSVEKLQTISGSGGSFTAAPLTGEVGDTVDYELVVKNTGNVPLSFGSEDVVDKNCGAISGGPASGTLEVGAQATYTCTHVLEEVGSYANKAELSGTPPVGDGPPITHTSNTVVVEVPLPPALPAPAFALEKLQQLAGAGGSYTSAQLSGAVGQTVDYEIIVKNDGNVPLTFSSFSDPQCDPGTIAGGPEGGAALPVGASTTYTCTHVLSAADGSAGSYTNTVTLTGDPPGGEGSPITSTSNTVVVAVSPTANGNTLSSTSSAGATGVLSSTSTQAPSKSGVLAFSSATLPKLTGPQGCVRHDFRVSLKSAGVASVTFYLDGHKLRTITSKNAHKGLLTLLINPDKLKVGPHKLKALITMKHTGSTTAKQGTRTVRILRCGSAALTPKFTG